MRKKENRMMTRRIVSYWISTVISIALMLFLVGVGALILVNARSVSDYFKENMRISVIMKQDVTEADALAYEKALYARDFIRETEFVSRERGVEEMSAMLGEDFLDIFETAPVPISVDVMLKAEYVAPDSLDRVRKSLSASPLVEDVVVEGSLVDALNANLRKISLVIAGFVLLLLFISFVLISNTVRLNVFSRRFTIHTMQLVGATRRFIRAPFMAQSVFQGLFAGFVAILLLIGALFALRSELSMLFELFLPSQLLAVCGIVLLTGVLITTVSTFFVVNRLVGFTKDELYSY